MQFTWHGLSCFEIVCKTPNGEVTVVTDPYQNNTGLRFPRTLEAQIVAMSHTGDDANNLGAVTGSPFVIQHPGEYEIKGVFLFGIGAGENILYRIEAEGIQVAHLGALSRVLTDEELQQLQNIDILLIPVGGGRVLTPKAASEVIAQVEPRVVIPMTHAVENLKESFAHIDDFCKALGACRREDMNKYKVTRKELPEEDMVIVSLTR